METISSQMLVAQWFKCLKVPLNLGSFKSEVMVKHKNWAPAKKLLLQIHTQNRWINTSKFSIICTLNPNTKATPIFNCSWSTFYELAAYYLSRPWEYCLYRSEHKIRLCCTECKMINKNTRQYLNKRLNTKRAALESSWRHITIFINEFDCIYYCFLNRNR